MRTGRRGVALLAGTLLACVLPALAWPAPLQARNRILRESFRMRFLRAPAPDFALPDLSGKIVRLGDLHGRLVLINFWYSSCPPCRKEMPDLATLQRLHDDRGLVVLGINLDTIMIPDTDGAQLRRFLETTRVPYPILVGDEKVFEAYGAVPVQPLSFLVDRDGQVVEIFWGAHPGIVFEKTLAPYLAEPPDRSP